MRRERQEATKPRAAPDAWPQRQRPLAERAHFVSMASLRGHGAGWRTRPEVCYGFGGWPGRREAGGRAMACAW